MPKFEVTEPLDVFEPRRRVRDLGQRLGFSSAGCQELAIVISELGSNIVKYGVRGHIQFDAISDAVRGAGIAIIAFDIGPPFENLSLALQDGFDDRGPIDPLTLMKRGGLGTGLGAIVRLTDVFRVEQQAIGKLIHTERFVKRPRASDRT